MVTVSRNSTVLDADGKPFKVAYLTEEQAAPTVGGVRSVWSDSVANGLDPRKLAAMLKAANEGDNREFLKLAEEMEERDGHYSSVLGQRKRAVSGIAPVVTPGDSSDDGKGKEIADAVEELVSAPIFADMVDDALDGIAKGYSCTESIWHRTSERWTPGEYIHRDPSFFQFDKETGRHLRLRVEGNADGEELRKHCWIVHRPKLKSGLTVRGGLARVVAWSFMLKSFTLQDWAAFLEVFGMPLRVGKYDDNASAEEKRILLRAVRDLGADAAAIIPKGMEIEFIEAGGGQGNAVFGAMTDYLDKQISKAVIGQTMTTDEGSSKSQSETHDEVRGDITASDARQLRTTINRDLIAPFVGFNWGWDVPPPTVEFPTGDAEDIQAMTDALSKVVPLGARIAVNDVNKLLGFRLPDEGEAILTPPNAQAELETAPQTASRQPCRSCGETHLASEQDQDDALVDEALDHWEADMAPMVSAVLQAAQSADGYDEFLASLDQLVPDSSALAERLAAQTMKARGNGELDG